MEADRIPGAALVVVEDGAVVHAKGYGLADVERKKPVDVDRTLFRIGSITKALTALALTGLAEREGIDLRAPVERYLPAGLIPQDPIDAPIQLRHLLSHTAGFDQTGLGRQVDDPAERPSLAEFLAARLVRVRPPGEVAVYDTYGMTLAGHLIERIGGLPYPEYMRERVFEPLGMNRTWVEAPPEARGDLAVGYGLEDDVLLPQEYEWYVTLPASSIDATTADMGKLLAALLGDGGALLSAETAGRVRNEVQLAYGPDLGAFSWGLWDEDRGGWRVLHHGGVMAGYTSELYLVPEAELGFFLAFNRDPETGPPPRLREALTAFVHDIVLPARAATEPPASAVRVATERFAGAYGYTVGCFTCEEGEGWGLGWQEVTAPEPGVVAIGDRRWLAVDSTGFRAAETGAPLRFLTDERGAVRYLVRGPNSWARLDERLLDEALGDGWRDRPPAPLVALVHRANEEWGAAAEAYASLSSRQPGNGAYAYWEGYAALSGGDPPRAISAFERARAKGKWPAWSRYYIAASHAAMGHPDLALDLLEQALDEGFGDPGLLASEPWWDPLRGKPEFQALVVRAES
jgi:CubicO group peptidase (beta-lactamase class C family)